MEPLKIVLLCILAAITYGILHDAAYGVGFFGGLILCGWVVLWRWRLATQPGQR